MISWGGGGGGGFGGVERSSRGQDLAYNLEITLEEAAIGADKEIELNCLGNYNK